MSNSGHQRGFTLIELLVVIAIIALLAAILFPIFVTAQGAARTARCQAQTKELVRALMMYTDDYHGMLPWVQFLTYHDFGGNVSSAPWIHMVRLYQPYVRNFDILICPVKKMSYAYNECLCGTLNSSFYPMGHAEVHFIKDRSGRLASAVPKAVRTPMFFDAKRYHEAPGDYGPNGWGWEPIDAIDTTRMLNLHNGGANYAFLDGHVKWYAPQGGFLMPIDGIDYDGNGTLGDKTTMR